MMLRLSIPITSRRKKLFLLAAVVVLILSFYPGMALATSGQDGPDLTEVKKQLVVGTKVTPPFAMKDADGNWTGISIDLWRQIAAELNLSYEWVELDQHGLLEGITNGSLDAVVANLTITPSRLDKFDFTYPFYTTGLGIAVRRQEGDVAMAIVMQVFSWAVLKIILAVVAILLLVGLAIWQFERKRNSEQFGGTTVEGIASGFWFSAVTMTTVGYGDKHPKTLGGRLVALFWMFVSVILVSIFTAMITSLLTVKQLAPSIRGLEDLKREKVGTLPYTTSEAFLKSHHIVFKTYPSALEGLDALGRGEIKALVYDIPALRYWIRQQFQGKIEVLPQTYSQENYGIALRDNSPLRKMINRVLLEKIRDQEWQGTLYHYLGG